MLTFSGCGAFLQKMVDPLNERLSSSKLHFNGSHHSALFVFMNSSVNFYRVNITNYYGFAVIGLDLKSIQCSHLLELLWMLMLLSLVRVSPQLEVAF